MERTSIDSHTFAIEMAQGLYKSELKLDFDRLAEIQMTVNVRLVLPLHGSSGVFFPQKGRFKVEICYFWRGFAPERGYL